MKKFVKRNTIICVFAFISIAIVVSYAITYNMQDYFGIEGWYSLFNNISISYIAAFIFYILQVYKPECDNGKQAKTILDPLFLDLVKFIEVTIACCRKYVSINESEKIVIDWDNKNEKIIYFVPIKRGINEGHRPAIRKSSKDISQLEEVYKQKIKEIKDRIVFKECDSDIISALSELEATDFYKSIISTAIVLEGTFVKFSHFHKKVDEFERIKDKFKKCCGIDCIYDIKSAETMEIAVSEAIIYKGALQVPSTDEFNDISFKEYMKLQLKPLIEDEVELNKTIDELFPKVMEKIKEKLK